MKNVNSAVLVVSFIALTGCISNAADTATPMPTNLTGIYKASFTGGSITWNIESDGTGVACEERVSMNTDAKLRDLVVNGDIVYDVFEFKVSDVSSAGFKAEGVSDLTFKKITKMPVACR